MQKCLGKLISFLLGLRPYNRLDIFLIFGVPKGFEKLKATHEKIDRDKENK